MIRSIAFLLAVLPCVTLAQDVGGILYVNKFGRSADVDGGVTTDIWDGADGATSTDVWVPPTTARLHNIVSTSVADDGFPAGTGARTVSVQGLDENWDLASETVTLNGTTDVATTITYVRIFRLIVLTVGSGGGNAGVITATAQTDATVTAAIAIGNNQTLMAIYTVPAGMSGRLLAYYASANRASPTGATLNIRLLVKPDASRSDAPYQLKHIIGVTRDGNTYMRHYFRHAMIIGEKSDIVMRVQDASNNDTDVSAGFDLEIIPN